MSSFWDQLQISTIVRLLEEFAETLDPVTLARNLGQIIDAIADPLPGDVSGLMSLSAAFARAGRDTTPIADDLKVMASAKLPAVWQGSAQTAATSVISDASGLVGQVQPVFSAAAAAIETYASTLGRLESQRNELITQFHAALNDSPDITIFGISIPIDPADWTGWVDSIRNMIYGSIDLYHDLEEAADILAGQFADAQKAAAGASLGTGIALTKMVILTSATVNGSSLLGSAQLAKLRQIMAGLSAAQRASLDAALYAAKSPLAEAYILKALAAGNSLSSVVTFAGEIRGKPDSWLVSHLSLASEPGVLSYGGSPLVQSTQTECGSASIVAARVLADPMFAYSLTTGTGGASLTGAQFAAKVAEVDQQVHDATNVIWPQNLGTSPWGVASGMNTGATAGSDYQVQVVDDTDPSSSYPALERAITAVDAGQPVPVLLAPTISGLVSGTSLHYVLITAHSGSQLSIYDPEGGTISQVPESDFLSGTMQSIDAGAPHVNAVIVPGT